MCWFIQPTCFRSYHETAPCKGLGTRGQQRHGEGFTNAVVATPVVGSCSDHDRSQLLLMVPWPEPFALAASQHTHAGLKVFSGLRACFTIQAAAQKCREMNAPWGVLLSQSMTGTGV